MVEREPEPVEEILNFEPFELVPASRKVFHETFRDPSQPGKALFLSLRKPDAVDLARMAAELNRMTAMYITGSDEMPAAPFRPVGGQPVEVSVELFTTPCLVYAMQAPPAENRQPRRWAPEQLVAFAIAMPAAWSQVMGKVAEIRRFGGPDEGNAWGLPTEE